MHTLHFVVLFCFVFKGGGRRGDLYPQRTVNRPAWNKQRQYGGVRVQKWHDARRPALACSRLSWRGITSEYKVHSCHTLELLFRKILSHLSWVRTFERFLNLASFFFSFFFNSLCFSSQHDYFASTRVKINSLRRLCKKVETFLFSELHLLFKLKKINNFNSLFFLKDTGSCLIDTIHAQNTVHVA